MLVNILVTRPTRYLAVEGSFSDSSAISYVLPVLWMTPYCPIISAMIAMQQAQCSVVQVDVLAAIAYWFYPHIHR